MEVTARVIIAILFIAIVALAVVFFGVFGLIPIKRITTVFEVEEKKIIIPVEERVIVETPKPPAPAEASEPQPQPPPEKVEPPPPFGMGRPEAPQQSNPVSPEVLPKETIKLQISSTSGITPAVFKAKAGATIMLSVTSADTQTHVFMFKEPELADVAIGVGPGETRLISFSVPQAGEYVFLCDVPGHAARGEQGTMIVE